MYRWQESRAARLDELEAAHRSVGGRGRGRRYATRELNHAYALLLAAEFQGFCRDLHAEASLAIASATSPLLRDIVVQSLLRKRLLALGNVSKKNVAADYGRFGIELWPACVAVDARTGPRLDRLERLIAWRNAIAHSDFDYVRREYGSQLNLAEVRSFRRGLNGLASTIDRVIRDRVEEATGERPW